MAHSLIWVVFIFWWKLVFDDSFTLKQMEEETREFLRERSDRIRLLHENQAKELERFDDESVRLGFR